VPVSIRKTGKGKYAVSTPGGTKAKGTTKAKAEAQKRLLNAVEHGFKPTGAKTHMMPGGKAMHGAHHPAPAKRKGR